MKACTCTPTTSIYDTGCLDCCVRLVKSVRSPADPKTARKVQEGMLAHIGKQASDAQRAATINALKGATA